MTNLTKYEMETVVNYNAGEQTATVYTRDKSVMRKLDWLVADYPESYKLLNQTEIDKTYSILLQTGCIALYAEVKPSYSYGQIQN